MGVCEITNKKTQNMCCGVCGRKMNANSCVKICALSCVIVQNMFFKCAFCQRGCYVRNVLRGCANTEPAAGASDPLPAAAPVASGPSHAAAPATSAVSVASGSAPAALVHSESKMSMVAHASSFNDETVDAALANSLTSPDASASMLSTTGKDMMPPAAAPPLSRGATLDRGMDVMASQNLSIMPESAVACAARKKQLAHEKEKERLCMHIAISECRCVMGMSRYVCL